MPTSKLDTKSLKHAIDKFGSLQKAAEALENERQALDKQNNQLAQNIAELELKRDKLFTEVTDVESKLGRQKKQLQSHSERVRQYGRQFDLFEGFLAMVAGSPSVTSSIEALIASFKELLDSGWPTSKNADDLRSLFVRTVMGDYLKCFRCDSCGAMFLVNKEPHYRYTSNYYVCPACHYHRAREDDCFIKAMVSEEQLENIRRVEELQKENEVLKPVKVFLNLPCEVCGQPITEWTDRDVERGASGLGWGHTACWNTDRGQTKQFFKLLKEEMEHHK